MSTQLLLTVDEYDRMVLRGEFDYLRERRIELIRGELRTMSPQSRPHNRIIAYLARWSMLHTSPDEIEVSIQGPIRIPKLESEPEPDVSWAKLAPNATRHAEPHEIVLLIEVAYSTQDYDLGEKALMYAQAGIADYWVVDVPAQTVHVLRQPSAKGYQDHREFHLGEEIAVLHVPRAILRLSELFAR